MPFEVSNVELNDIAEIWDIVCENNWISYSIEDLYYILAVSPECCYKLIIDGVIVGGVFGTFENKKMCISFFCVQSNMRKLNSSLNLGMKIIDFSRDKSLYTMTYANPRMIRAYKRFGFIEDCYIENFIVKITNMDFRKSNCIQEITKESINQNMYINDYIDDKKCFCRYFDYSQSQCYFYKSSLGMGYIFSRKHILGPLVADNDDIARSLLIHVMKYNNNYTVFGERDIVKRLFDSDLFSYKETNVKLLKMILDKKKKGNEKNKLVGGHHFIS